MTQSAAPSASLSIPDPAAFRAWLGNTIAALGTSAAALSKDCDLGRNTVANFLNGTTGSMGLAAASAIEAAAFARAAASGVDLARADGWPPMPDLVSSRLAGKHRRIFEAMRAEAGSSPEALELAILEKYLSLIAECPDVLGGAAPIPMAAKIGGRRG